MSRRPNRPVLSDIEKVFLLKLLNQAGQTRGNYMARPNFGVQESALALDFSDSGKLFQKAGLSLN